jgi:hypothetical protein
VRSGILACDDDHSKELRIGAICQTEFSVSVKGTLTCQANPGEVADCAGYPKIGDSELGNYVLPACVY